MSIDFYKKRGFTPLEIKELMESGERDGITSLSRKISEAENNIRIQQRILKRLAETKVFCEYAALSSKLFTVKELPLYLVLETFDAVSSLNDYKDRVLAFMDLQEDDILSSLVRAVTFDQTGYKGTKMCLVRSAVKKCKPEKKHILKAVNVCILYWKQTVTTIPLWKKCFLPPMAGQENIKKPSKVLSIFSFVLLSFQDIQSAIFTRCLSL